MKKTYNWGIIGPGYIANRIMEGFKLVPQASVVAVASKTQGKAEAFAKKWEIPRSYDNYEALASDPDIDMVFVTTTNSFHLENSLLAMQHGKHVLCEKPLAMNAEQAQMMADAAKENGVFLMEAMWSRFFPIMYKLRELLSEGIIGEIRNLVADFSFEGPSDSEYRLYKASMGGGTLVDAGVYPLAFACMVYGKLPNRCTGLANLWNGVDVRSDAVVGFEGGGLATIISGADVKTPWDGVIYGEKGYIHVPQFWSADTIEIKLKDEEKVQSIKMPFESLGYQFEITEVIECVEKGLSESPLMPLDESIGIASVMDDLRRQWGVIYPGE